jgi:hypothetical protein
VFECGGSVEFGFASTQGVDAHLSTLFVYTAFVLAVGQGYHISVQ